MAKIKPPDDPMGCKVDCEQYAPVRSRVPDARIAIDRYIRDFAIERRSYFVTCDSAFRNARDFFRGLEIDDADVRVGLVDCDKGSRWRLSENAMRQWKIEQEDRDETEDE
jgi:hypothetical protein